MKQIKLIYVRAFLTALFLTFALGTGALLIPRAAAQGAGGTFVPLGYCQLTSIDTAAALTACSGGIPEGATGAMIEAETQAVRYRDDAVNPTTTVGMPVAVGTPFFYSGTLSKVRVIAAVSGAKLNLLFYR